MSKSKQLKNSKLKQQFLNGSQLNIFDRKQILDKQNKLKKFYQNYKQPIRQRPNSHIKLQFFSKLKYQQYIYEVGQFIELYSINHIDVFVARLTNIIKVIGKPQLNYFIEVQWVLKKTDLPQKIIDKYGHFLSAAEVFPSEERIYLFVQSIKCKCIILNLNQYGQLGVTNDTIYYTRACFDKNSSCLIPDPQQWVISDCDCKFPTNPDLQYVECSKCTRWFHIQCVKSKIINGIFLCDSCFSNKNTSLKISNYQ